MGGCGVISQKSPLTDQAIELADTPFYPQEAYQCGPATLATVLNTADTAVTANDLLPQIYLPGKQGTFSIEIVATTRSYGRLPYPIAPTPAALLAELKAGRPVLILQSLGVKTYPIWHYAVVIGYDPIDDSFILRSGTTQRLKTKTHKFLNSWEKANFWGIVILKPGELPAQLDTNKYLKVVADLTSNQQWEAAAKSYQALANHLANQGCYGEATHFINQALTLPVSYALQNALKTTQYKWENNLKHKECFQH